MAYTDQFLCEEIKYSSGFLCLTYYDCRITQNGGGRTFTKSFTLLGTRSNRLDYSWKWVIEHSNSGKKSFDSIRFDSRYGIDFFDSIRFGNLINLPLVQ